MRARLENEEFRLPRLLNGETVSLHFGGEFPGDALGLYPRFLAATGEDGIVHGSYVVVELEEGEVVGQLGTLGPPAGDEVEIGYGINASAQRRGIATAAVEELVRILDATSAVGRIMARTAVANPASGRVLEKNGFSAVGREASDEGELLVWQYAGSRT